LSIPESSRPAVTRQSDAGDDAAAARSRSARILVACVMAVLVAAGVAWLLLPNAGTRAGSRDAAARPTLPVGYSVTGTGTARITYTQPDGTSRTFTAHLPWRHTTALTDSTPAALTILLGPGGGHATCALTVRGTAVQHATAYGTYGRATCTAPPGAAR
jgi:hypothetical protein